MIGPLFNCQHLVIIIITFIIAIIQTSLSFWMFNHPLLGLNLHKKQLPSHNFWPYIPIKRPIIEDHDGKQNSELPSHNFWPWIHINDPLDNDLKKNQTHLQHPDHGFWPFFPMKTVTKTTTWTPFTQPPTPPTFAPQKYNYGEVLYKSILFYEAQRSGQLPINQKVTWRKHSALGDRGLHGEDLTGGWYDAGDYVKFGVPMATATTMLLWGFIEYGDAYRSIGIMEEMKDCVRWPLDYFVKAHTNNYEFYGQVGDPYLDHTFWGRPEDMKMERPAFKLTPEAPGSDLVADTSAAMAAGYIAFKDDDATYATLLLTHAQRLFEMAVNFRGSYSDSIPNAWEFYRSYRDEDELAWAALWLYQATRSRYYLDKARYFYTQMDSCWAQSWADKACAVPILLYKVTREVQFKTSVESLMVNWLPGGSIHYTPKGLAYRGPWGPLRYTANMAFLALVAADLDIEHSRYRRWALSQINYMLGDGGRSYVIGFGKNSPTRPHHASSSCPSPPKPCSWSDYEKLAPNEHILYGALVGGPDSNDEFEDRRDDFMHNEVGVEYNSGFQSAVAGLRYLEIHLSL